MKKSLVAIAALAATGAFAQSSVTLSGVMDVGAVYRSNTAPGLNKVGLDRLNNNRLIFSGVEDLGGGLAATFAAQMRFEPTSGTNEGGSAGYVGTGLTAGPGVVIPAVFPACSTSVGRDGNGNCLSGPGLAFGRPLFQGETRVGLRGGFGAIRLGRGLTALQAPNSVAIDPWVVTTVASSVYAPGYSTDYVAGGDGRTDGIFYDTPNFSGLSASFTYSPRKVNTLSKPFTSFAVNYNNGPIVAIAGYEQNRYGDSLTNVGGNYNLGVAKIYLGYGGVKGGDATLRNGVAYLSGSAGMPGYGNGAPVLGGMTKFGQTTANIAAGTKIDAFSVGATAPFGPAKVLFGFSSYKSNIVGAQRDSKIGLGVNYALSKRTSVYSDIASTTRKNNLAGANPANNNDRITQMDLGIAHSF